jgi:hypothetical protein
MKIVTFISLFLCGLSYSQGNLQFNQVKIVSNTDASQTVPAGKVWKIESVFSEGGDTYPMGASGTVYAHFSACGLASFNFQNYGRYLSINNIPVAFGIHSAGSQMTNLPVWLPSGTTICTCIPSYICARGYSVIEFNIIP